jgi:hypothetical protein
MPPVTGDTEFPARLRRFAPYAAILLLWLLFELPTSLRPRGANLAGMRPTAEFLAMVTAYAALRGTRHERVLRRVWFALVVLLIAVRIDWTACWLITRSRPLFYDQIFLLRHLMVLIGDLWSAPMALVLVGLALLVYGVIRLSRVLGKVADPLFVPPRRRRALVALAGAWAVLGLLALSGRAPGEKEPRVRWMTGELLANVHESVRTYRAVRSGIFDSPYKRYAGTKLERRPNVSFFFVESYGRIIPDSPDLSPPWSARLGDMQAHLSAEGYHMASAFSTAPVSGGRSWLAVGSIFMGTSLPYEAVFRHLVREVQHLPTLVSFFAARGYDTIALEPSDRVRPGVEEANYYHFAQQIRFDDLDYRGPQAGWGLVPDQYSLGFAEEHALRGARPRFFLFHMVTSHMPWAVTPPLVGDYHALNEAPGKPIENAHDEHLSLFDRADALSTRLRRYGREEMMKWVKYRGYTAEHRERYVDTVNYDLSVIERHLASEHADELVVVMGDHQPPAVSPDGENFDVPVHVFARDPALLEEFIAHGFTPGLVPDVKAKPAVEHAALFSILVRALVRVQPGSPEMPPYLPRGSPLTG